MIVLITRNAGSWNVMKRVFHTEEDIYYACVVYNINKDGSITIKKANFVLDTSYSNEAALWADIAERKLLWFDGQ
jgi:esterase/lipase